MKKGKLIAIAGMVLVMGSAFPVSAAESLADFDYRTYADTYPDLKAAFGYDAAALYNHYETNPASCWGSEVEGDRVFHWR